MKSPGNINNLSSEAERKHNCQKQTQLPQPGIAQGSCAFDSAMMTLVPITDAAHVVHGPSGCATSAWGSCSSLYSGSMLHKIRFTSDMDESDIIFGGAKKLYKGILELQRRYKPAAVFVYSTCITALIGDDIAGVCKDVTNQTGIPTIPVIAPGFVGSQNLGTRIASDAILSHVIGTGEPNYTTPYDINLISEYNINSSIRKVLPLFEKLGIRVLARITGDARYRELCYAHRAKLNVVISSKALVNMARKMEKRFGIPYIEESLHSIEDISLCLRNIATHLGDADLQERTEKLIAQESSAIQEKLTLYRDRLQSKRVLIIPDDFKSWSIISVAKNLGMEVIAISTDAHNQEDRARIKRLLNQDSIILEKDTLEEIQHLIIENKAEMLIADGRFQESANRAKIPFLSISQERHCLHTGYAGILEVAQELYATFTSPIWRQVYQPVVWKNRGGEGETESKIPLPLQL